MEIRVRYAPSPTGLQHIGSVRTALINYLFARANGGAFILRLEDTDRTRYSDDYVKNLYETFKWLGFYWDEGPDIGGPYAPYVQSKRLQQYSAFAKELVDTSMAYYCFCGEERLAQVRAEQEDSERIRPGLRPALQEYNARRGRRARGSRREGRDPPQDSPRGIDEIP